MGLPLVQLYPTLPLESVCMLARFNAVKSLIRDAPAFRVAAVVLPFAPQITPSRFTGAGRVTALGVASMRICNMGTSAGPLTISGTATVDVLYAVASVGAKVNDRVGVPTSRIVPAGRH